MTSNVSSRNREHVMLSGGKDSEYERPVPLQSPEAHDKFVREKRRIFILKEIFRDSRSARQEKQDRVSRIVPP